MGPVTVEFVLYFDISFFLFIFWVHSVRSYSKEALICHNTFLPSPFISRDLLSYLGPILAQIL